MPVAKDEVNQDLVERYEKAYWALSNNDADADQLFATLEGMYPQDPLVKLHVKRMESGEGGTTLIIRKK
jgi:hypothetical protein